jgi:hypothetical protein
MFKSRKKPHTDHAGTTWREAELLERERKLQKLLPQAKELKKQATKLFESVTKEFNLSCVDSDFIKAKEVSRVWSKSRNGLSTIKYAYLTDTEEFLEDLQEWIEFVQAFIVKVEFFLEVIAIAKDCFR